MYGGVGKAKLHEFKEMEKENARLKRIVADRSGSVCLNSMKGFYKWMLTLFMLPPVLVATH